MSTTNYISTTIKILEQPRKKISKMSVLTTEVRAQVSHVRNKPSQTFASLIFWGNLGEAVLNYYRPNDYLIVEGYISIKNKKNLNIHPQLVKQVEITVFKVYPFFLKPI